MSFAEKLTQAMEDAVVKQVRDGQWIGVEYSARPKIDAPTLREVYESVDMERVKARVVEQVEGHIADKILHSMATEVATDVKQILSNKELREDVRAIIREKIRAAAAAV